VQHYLIAVTMNIGKPAQGCTFYRHFWDMVMLCTKACGRIFGLPVTEMRAFDELVSQKKPTKI